MPDAGCFFAGDCASVPITPAVRGAGGDVSPFLPTGSDEGLNVGLGQAYVSPEPDDGYAALGDQPANEADGDVQQLGCLLHREQLALRHSRCTPPTR